MTTTTFAQVGDQLWWYVARAGGIVALVLAASSIIWGLLLSSGFLERTPTKRWLKNVHSWLGGLTVTFTAVHILGLRLDSYIEYSIADLFIPFVATERPGALPIAWGIVTFYLLLAVQGTSLLMRRLPRTWWRAIHLTSYGILGMGITHGATAGTDATNPLYLGSILMLGFSTVFLLTYRILTSRKVRKGTHNADGKPAS